MQTEVETLRDIPCAKCMFWEPLRQDPLYCNPVECQQLTQWLFDETSKKKQIQRARPLKTKNKGGS